MSTDANKPMLEEESKINIDVGCLVSFSVTEDGKLQIAFNITKGRESQFVGLLYKLHSGKLRDFVDNYILEFCKQFGQKEYGQMITDAIDKEFAANSYEKFIPDDEDPVICPTNVFRGQKDE